ncbi:VWA domain-containing protein [Mycobacterium sp. NPDC051804]|uniref:VWA domain-containing protein n=1 Tax=Mycobacterium sp. NPDC051804 TaxID=3364295 RepID=UPI0037BBCB9F
MRPDYCTVYDIESTAVDRHASLHQLADAELRRRIARVVLSPAPSRRRADGDEIDLEAAVDARATLAATGFGEEQVWIAPRLRRPDLAVLVLVDLSGSVSSTSSGVSTHRRQIELAEVIADALHAVGGRLAVHGFRSQDRRNVELVCVLPFGMGWDDLARRRLHACEPCGFTRLGAAIRRASDVIDEDRGATRRLLIVVSDGVAYDSGYEGSYAEADTRRALREANSRAIGTLCVTVGADTSEDALARVFGSAPRVRARTSGDLRGPLPTVIRAALATARARN